ncbi:MAG TPA: class I SAM-dependent methyltransferase [Alphaproteobacteria bacterium]|nr:class I SAM-dependent methyltransferase [Alphaproteobacteria bacterium]
MANKNGASGRTLQQLRNHYEVEKALAQKLKTASREERPQIYATMYQELFAKVPDHPRLTRREDPSAARRRVCRGLKLIQQALQPSTTFLEFGPGDCRFALEVAKYVGQVYAVDISCQIGNSQEIPPNFSFIAYDGYRLALPDQCIDVAFSDQLLEHLHPDDVRLHLQTVGRILKEGGLYIFTTPHRFSGPHDISRRFSDEAEGFHLKEWTYRELIQLLLELGFARLRGFRFARGSVLPAPLPLMTALERIFERREKSIQRKIGRWLMPHIILSATKLRARMP